MAKITPSPLVSKISGKIGNMIFSSWKGTQYAKLLPISIHNPGSSDQAKYRSNLVNLLAGWKNLSASQKGLWSEYAQFLGSAESETSSVGTRALIKPVGKVMTGMNAYIMVNQRLFSVDLDKVDVPPVNPVPGPISIEIDENPGPLLGVSVFFPEGSTSSGDRARLWIRNNRAGGHTYLVASEAPTGVEDNQDLARFSDIDFLKVGHEGSIVDVDWEQVIGYPISIQADLISASGYKSPASAVLDFTVEA